MSNWDYGRTTPASTWRGVMTVPRELSLHRADGEVALAQRPVPELATAWGAVQQRHGLRLGPDTPWEPDAPAAAYDLRLCVDLTGDADEVVVEVHRGSGVPTRVVCLPGQRVLRVQRAVDGIDGAVPGAVQEVALAGDELDLRVVVDTCSVEVFADGGRLVLTNQVFPAPGATGLRVCAGGGEAVLRELSFAALDPAGRHTPGGS
jgi:sucrose-6-phosphate hydrolase SacC (GH32 family)